MITAWLFITALLIFLLFIAVISQSVTLLIIAAVIFAFILLSSILYRCLPIRIEAVYNFKSSCEKEETVYGDVEIKNSSLLPYNSVKICIEIKNKLTDNVTTQYKKAFIPPSSTVKIPLKFKSSLCGNVEIAVKSIRLYDFFCLTHRTSAINNKCSVLVLPQLYSINSFGFGLHETIDSFSYAENKQGFDISEVYDYRDYQKGDSPKSIHWKLSTKYDRLIVKEGSLPSENYVLILFNNIKGDSPTAAAQLAEALISVSQELCEKNIAHTLICFKSSTEALTQVIENSGDISAALPSLLSTAESSINIKDSVNADCIDDYSTIFLFTENTPNIQNDDITVITPQEIKEIINIEPR